MKEFHKLNCCQVVISILGCEDMQRNAGMIETHARACELVSLEDLIDLERSKAGSYYAAACEEGSTAMGLLWLLRALRLLQRTLEELLREPEQSLHRCIQRGYELTLKPHHNFLTRNVIQAAIRAAPSRAVFLQKLSPDDSELKATESKIQLFLQVYSPVLQKAHAFLLTCGLES